MSSRRGTKQHHTVAGLSPYSRRLLCEELEDRRLLSLAPLNVALISSGVAQAAQIQHAAAKDTIPIIYNADTMTVTGMVDLLQSVSAAHDGDLIGPCRHRRERRAGRS